MPASTDPLSPRIAAVDGARALAAGYVFLYHMWQFAGVPSLHIGALDLMWIVSQGFSGVDLFIVLSGLCIFLPYVDRGRPWSLRGYATRRIWRIVPPYYIAIAYLTILPSLLVIVTRALGRESHLQALPSVADYVTHLTFTHTLFPSTWSGIQGAFWTIGLEAQLYVIFPVVLLAYRRWGIRAIWCGIAASIVFNIVANAATLDWSDTARFLIGISLPGRWMQFGAGMLVAIGFHHMRQSQERNITRRALGFLPSWVWILSATSVFLIASITQVADFLWLPVRTILMALAGALLLVGSCLTKTRLASPLRWRPMVWFGSISYSFYLVHQNTGFYLSELAKKVLGVSGWGDLAFLLTGGFAIILGLAWLMNRYVELPATATGKRRARRSESAGSLAR